MRVELLRNIVHALIGEKSKGIVDLLAEKENVNEFLIAKKLGLTINQTRNLLYKLLDEGLVTVVRKKNKKKGGWYDHFWTLNLEKSLHKYLEVLRIKIEHLNQEMHTRKNSRYYFCDVCSIELDEEHALLQEYACVECGQLLVLKDNSLDISNLEKEKVRLEKENLEIEEELSQFVEKVEKKKERKRKIEEKKVAIEKAEKRAAKAKERAKEKAKSSKKTSLKKPNKKVISKNMKKKRA
jgi:transcription factor E